MDGLQHLAFKYSLTYSALSEAIPLAETDAHMACGYMQALWTDIESELPPSERVVAPTFDVSDNVWDGIRVRVFVPPGGGTTTRATRFFGLVILDGCRRVFLLEPTPIEPPPVQSIACLVEWTRTHRLNYGGFILEPSFNAADFTEIVAAIIRQQERPGMVVLDPPIFATSIEEFRILKAHEMTLRPTPVANAASGELTPPTDR